MILEKFYSAVLGIEAQEKTAPSNSYQEMFQKALERNQTVLSDEDYFYLAVALEALSVAKK